VPSGWSNGAEGEDKTLKTACRPLPKLYARGHARDPEETISHLIAVLDTQTVAEAIERLEAPRFGLKVVN
jgi:hypothetical protein